MARSQLDSHRHIGALPAYPFYGGPAIRADVTAKATVAEFVATLDAEGTDRALVLPNYGVPVPDAAFDLNPLAIEAAQKDDRISCGLWVSPKASDATRNDAALALVGEQGVKALKTSFLLGGSPSDPDCAEQIDRIFTTAAAHDLVVHVHTSPGAASDVDEVGTLVERYGDDTKIHLVHLGGGMSGHMKLIGGRLFDWIEAGKQVYTDTSWTIGFAPAWLVQEIERRGVGHDRILFATDAPWGDFEGEHARLSAAAGDGELADHFFRRNFEALYGT
ncbi:MULTISPECIES: amidohydrolase family protein [unclassified Aeromicrobium]|uniref:amidohydrolase family protein n=1 Tax=unclassified Aeromicrobium TaxID=2633570 RepID=UPI0006F3ABE2|nr:MULTISPECIES: amidohydrolase family protein [unclassified Aeromicrobium]KQO39168.1 amidohydrolase [Aeromicrobium sp. Leaf245]KQP82434.1 amidohydrolase [Aeromicrobium sp. Leaf291]